MFDVPELLRLPPFLFQIERRDHRHTVHVQVQIGNPLLVACRHPPALRSASLRPDAFVRACSRWQEDLASVFGTVFPRR